MKNFKNILLLFSLGIILASCTDATDIVQIDNLGIEESFTNLDDVQTALNSAYASYSPSAGSNAATQEAIFFNTVFGDNAKEGEDSNGQGAQLYSFTMQPASSTPTNIYDRRYDVIYYANLTLQAINGLTLESGEMDRANHIKAQAIALRALAHFDLFKYFTTDYKDPNALSVIMLDFVPAVLDAFERNTVAEVLQFIKTDLQDAGDLFVDSQTNATNKFYVTRGFLKALRTQVALFEGDYTTAETLSNELVTEFPLANNTDYTDLWSDNGQEELIFGLSRINGGGSIATLFAFNLPGAGGGAFIEMSNGLLNLYETNDIRRTAFLHPTSTFAGVNSVNNKLFIGKYSGSADGPTINDVKIFRSSEMLLIRAEAEARDLRFGDAANSVQELRTLRYGGFPPALPTYNNLTEALTDILLERRKELCFEGHRVIDIKRMNPDLATGINKQAVDCASFSSSQCGLAASDDKFTLPIPQAELDGNNLITQNPGYTN